MIVARGDKVLRPKTLSGFSFQVSQEVVGFLGPNGGQDDHSQDHDALLYTPEPCGA
jgi:hypothetical protein